MKLRVTRKILLHQHMLMSATFPLHTQRNPPPTFGQLAVALRNQLTCMAQQVRIVCDIYNTPSIKYAERQRRGSDDMVFI